MELGGRIPLPLEVFRGLVHDPEDILCIVHFRLCHWFSLDSVQPVAILAVKVSRIAVC